MFLCHEAGVCDVPAVVGRHEPDDWVRSALAALKEHLCDVRGFDRVALLEQTTQRVD